MPVRLIAGRAGSGKTHWCQAQIRQALASSLADGPRLILLVPEQAGLQMERALVTRSPVKVLGRCDVLSFRRLAHRILNESPGGTPVALTPIGRQMALRHLIGRHLRSLREFGKVAQRGGFVAGIARSIVELMQESVSPEQLDAAAHAADSASDPTAPRLHDTALLYRAYLEYLGSARVDPEGVLDLARVRLDAVPWIRGACLWIDGFAGLARQQIRMIVELARRAAQVDIALLLDPARGRTQDADAPPDELSLFARTEQTWFKLARALHDAGVPIEEPVLLGLQDRPRFFGARMLARIEREFFAAPPVGMEEIDRRSTADYARRPIQEGDGGVRFAKAPNRRAEVAAAVRSLVDLVQRPESPLRYRDVSIVVRDLEPYHELISAALRAHAVPFFIDRRRPTFDHPLVQCVRALLAMHGEGPFDQAVAMLLKCGLTGVSDVAADALENYLLAHGLVSATAWDEPWTYPASPGKGRRRKRRQPEPAVAWQAPRIVEESRDRLRTVVGEWWPSAAAQQTGPQPCGHWVRRLYEALDRLAVPARLASWAGHATARGDLDEAAEHEQVWSDLVKLLDELAATLGDEPMSGRQFREVLESGLSEFTLGLVPATLDQVLVSSIERSRHPPVKAVFVLGFNDGLFPARLSEDSILGDEERQRLEQSGIELGRTRARQLLDERMLAYVAFTRPSEFLWVSFAASDEAGDALEPSPYWPYQLAASPGGPIETIDPDRPEAVTSAGQLAAGVAQHARAWCEQRADAASDTWLSLYEWGRSTEPVAGVVGAALAALAPPRRAELSANAAAALWPPPYRTSVTRLEQFARCPFQHFAAHGVQLEPRPRHEIAALDMGRLYHMVLEQFVNELIESGTTLREMPLPRIAEDLSRLCRSIVPQYAEQIRMEQREQRAAMWRGQLELPTASAGEKAALGRTRLRPIGTEQSFGDSPDDALPALELELSDARQVLVRGVIDRIDVLPADEASLAVVFDYKRKLDERLDLQAVYHGLALQLLAYLLVLREHGERLSGAKLIPGGAFYLPLLGKLNPVEHPAEADEDEFEPYKPFRPRGIVDFDWIDRLDPTLTSGRSAAFSVYRNKDGGIGYLDRSDAVPSDGLALLLKLVRQKMTELAAEWLSGRIEVSPVRLGDYTPCNECLFRTVCRIEYATRETRVLRKMKRSDVLDALASPAGGADG